MRRAIALLLFSIFLVSLLPLASANTSLVQINNVDFANLSTNQVESYFHIQESNSQYQVASGSDFGLSSNMLWVQGNPVTTQNTIKELFTYAPPSGIGTFTPNKQSTLFFTTQITPLDTAWQYQGSTIQNYQTEDANVYTSFALVGEGGTAVVELTVYTQVLGAASATVGNQIIHTYVNFYYNSQLVYNQTGDSSPFIFTVATNGSSLYLFAGNNIDTTPLYQSTNVQIGQITPSFIYQATFFSNSWLGSVIDPPSMIGFLQIQQSKISVSISGPATVKANTFNTYTASVNNIPGWGSVNYSWSVLGTTISGYGQSFNFEFPNGGSYVLEVVVSTVYNVASAEFGITVSGASGPTYMLSGKVIATNSTPISGATVTLGTYTATTSSSGTFQISAQSGTYILTIQKTGYNTYQTTITLNSNLSQTYTLSVNTTTTSSGGGFLSGGSSGSFYWQEVGILAFILIAGVVAFPALLMKNGDKKKAFGVALGSVVAMFAVITIIDQIWYLAGIIVTVDIFIYSVVFGVNFE